MTQEEINEGNKLIAEFMAWGKSKQGQWSRPEDISIIEDEMWSAKWEGHLKFHTSWDWLMPVVEKIEAEHGCIVEIFLSLGRGCKIIKVNGSRPSQPVKTFLGENNVTIMAVYGAVVQFIKWHNTQNK